ncbi:MAG TPA: DsrE family protein [Candidatus Wallbacteria bacterium]|nr:DsrE family protein [Candidatus Wallbacteria bacterium]
MEKIIYLNSESIGTGSEELGKILTRNFLLTVKAENIKIKAIFLLNSAVRLASEKSHVLDVLNDFINDGVKVYSCGTCLDYFGLKDKIAAGEPGNMKTLCSVLSDENIHIIKP